MLGNRPWYDFYPPELPRTMDYPEVTLPQVVDKVAMEFPEHKAVIFMGVEVTYARLQAMVDVFATALSNLGVKKGDRVALMAPNSLQYIISFLAVQKLGAIVVQVNPMYVERELEYILNDSGAETIVVYDALYPRVKNVRQETSLRHVITFSLGKPAGTADEDCYVAEELLENTSPAAPNVDIDIYNDVAILQYTGGTTGVSKGAMLTHRNIVVNSYQIRAWLHNLNYGTETFLAVAPYFHIYGVATSLGAPLADAATMVPLPKFDAVQTMQAIQEHKVTVFPGVPTMYVAINNSPEVQNYALSSIKNCISGSAPLPAEVQNKFEALTGCHMIEAYGLTETSPGTHSNPVGGKRKAGSIGLPFPDTDAKIVDLETGTRDLPPGQEGELCIKGPQLMKGYWNMPEETAHAIRDGWFYTGDIAVMDEEGYFYIVDRKKDMILAGGYNIYPREIEEVLFEHPKVLEAVAVGVNDPYRGETVKSFIALKEGEQATEEEIIQFCKDKLAAYKVPKMVEIRDSLPKTTVGKMLRRKLKEEEEKR